MYEEARQIAERYGKVIAKEDLKAGEYYWGYFTRAGWAMMRWDGRRFLYYEIDCGQVCVHDAGYCLADGAEVAGFYPLRAGLPVALRYTHEELLGQ